MTRKQLRKITDLFPPAAGGAIAETFARIGVAEEIIVEKKLSKEEGSRAFKVLCPSEPLRGKGEAIYRAHAAQICVRVKAGLPLEAATDAELLAALLDTSLKAPLTSWGQEIAEYLFARVFPEKAAEVLGDRLRDARNELSLYAKEEFERMRQKFQFEERKSA